MLKPKIKMWKLSDLTVGGYEVDSLSQQGRPVRVQDARAHSSPLPSLPTDPIPSTLISSDPALIPMATHHTTPLRRISHGSLSQSAQASTSSPTQLDFLAQPLADLVDEIDALHQNLININQLSDSLGAFNEGFATFLYGMRMNAFSVEWPQVSHQQELNPPFLVSPVRTTPRGERSSLPPHQSSGLTSPSVPWQAPTDLSFEMHDSTIIHPPRT